MTAATRHIITRAAAILAGAAALLCLYAAVHHLRLPMPRCIFHELSGWQCPGCGTQRALADFARGEILAGWSRNLLLPPAMALVALLIILPPGNRLKERLNSPAAIYTIMAIVLAWWVLRNVITSLPH